MEKRKKNPFIAIVILTGLMFLPFLAFLFDKFLLKLDNYFLIVAETVIVVIGLFSALLIYYFFFKN